MGGGEGPSNAACSFNYYYYYYYYYYTPERITFLRGNTYSKSCETLQAHCGWRKISYSNIRKKGRGLMAQRRPKSCSPAIRFHVNLPKSVHICIMSVRTKKPLGAMSETKQEVGYCRVLVHFRPFSQVVL